MLGLFTGSFVFLPVLFYLAPFAMFFLLIGSASVEGKVNNSARQQAKTWTQETATLHLSLQDLQGGRNGRITDFYARHALRTASRQASSKMTLAKSFGFVTQNKNVHLPLWTYWPPIPESAFTTADAARLWGNLAPPPVEVFA
ncbi:MAG: hypothetical protein AABZ44_04680 [Elusimicrobiota bacterium]